MTASVVDMHRLVLIQTLVTLLVHYRATPVPTSSTASPSMAAAAAAMLLLCWRRASAHWKRALDGRGARCARSPAQTVLAGWSEMPWHQQEIYVSGSSTWIHTGRRRKIFRTHWSRTRPMAVDIRLSDELKVVCMANAVGAKVVRALWGLFSTYWATIGLKARNRKRKNRAQISFRRHWWEKENKKKLWLNISFDRCQI